MEKNFSIIFE